MPDVECEEIVFDDDHYQPAQPQELRFNDQVSPLHEGTPFSVQPTIQPFDTNVSLVHYKFMYI